MKRVTVFLILAIGLVGVAWLLMSLTGEESLRDRREGDVARASRADGEGSGEPAGRSPCGPREQKPARVPAEAAVPASAARARVAVAPEGAHRRRTSATRDRAG